MAFLAGPGVRSGKAGDGNTWPGRAVSPAASGRCRSPAFRPLAAFEAAEDGVGRCRTCCGDAKSGECDEDVANAAVVHGLAPCGLRESPFNMDAVSSRRQYRFPWITITASYGPRSLHCVAHFANAAAAAFRSPSSRSRPGRGLHRRRSRRMRPLRSRRRGCAPGTVAAGPPRCRRPPGPPTPEPSPAPAAPGDGGRARGGAHRHRIRDPAHPLGRRRTGGDVGVAAAQGARRGARAHRHRAGARVREAAPREARRRRRPPTYIFTERGAGDRMAKPGEE